MIMGGQTNNNWYDTMKKSQKFALFVLFVLCFVTLIVAILNANDLTIATKQQVFYAFLLSAFSYFVLLYLE